MIASRQPQSAVALQTFKPRQNILQSLIQRMPHVKLTCDIRRRHHDGERLFIGIHFRVECTVRLPHLINAILKILRIVSLC